MPAPNLGPSYDAAVRLRAIEDRLARLEANPYGQAFSATQSDGSVGLQIMQDTAGSGATGSRWFQGPTTSRDPSTNQHPLMQYIGELFSGGVSVDSGILWYRPTGAASGVVGNRGVQLFDPQGNQVLATDEYGASPSEVGLNSPWIPLGQPMVAAPGASAGWPNTTSGSSGAVSYLQFPGQHSHITWYGSTYLPAGCTGTVQVTVNNGAAGASLSVGPGFTNLNETFSLGTWTWHQTMQLAGNAALTSGAGPIYFAIFGVWGCGSGT